MEEVVQLTANYIMVMFALWGEAVLFVGFILVVNHAIKNTI
jgi:hypothetical protein